MNIRILFHDKCHISETGNKRDCWINSFDLYNYAEVIIHIKLHTHLLNCVFRILIIKFELNIKV